MSQVGTPKDALAAKRAKTMEQERQIDTSSFTKKWQLSDAVKTTMAERIIGIIVLPILGLWAFLTFLMGLVVGIMSWIFRGFSFIFGHLGAFPKSKNS